LSQVLAEAGTALPTWVNRRVGERVGRDLSTVRVHTGPAAATLAGTVGAEAFTIGKHIVFSQGRYRPDTPAGLNLLTHELVHTAQQGAAPARGESPIRGVAARGAIQRRVDPQAQQDPWRLSAGSRGYQVALARHHREPPPHEDVQDGLGFEVVPGKLLATLHGPGDAVLLRIFVAEMRTLMSEEERATSPALPAALPTDGGRIDVTPYLPARVRAFLELYRDYLRHLENFAAEQRLQGREPPVENESEAGRAELQQWDLDLQKHMENAEFAALAAPIHAQREQEREQYQARIAAAGGDRAATWSISESRRVGRGEQDAELATARITARERTQQMLKAWQTNCHRFAMLFVRGVALDTAESALSNDQIRASIRGKGPLRRIERGDRRPGDIISFMASIDVKDLRSEKGLMHSVVIIRVSGPHDRDVEVLEKVDDSRPMRTRTLEQLRQTYGHTLPILYYLRR
jgi:hypothetical protein